RALPQIRIRDFRSPRKLLPESRRIGAFAQPENPSVVLNTVASLLTPRFRRVTVKPSRAALLSTLDEKHPKIQLFVLRRRNAWPQCSGTLGTYSSIRTPSISVYSSSTR